MYVLTIPGDGRLGAESGTGTDRPDRSQSRFRHGRLGNDVVLPSGGWHELRFDWSDSQSSICKVTIDGRSASLTLPLVRPSVNGISYVHFQALSDEEDQQGFLIESVEGGMSPKQNTMDTHGTGN